MRKISIIALLTGLIAISCSNTEKQVANEQQMVIEHKIDSILKKMTLEEKIGQMNQLNSRGAATGPVLGIKDEMKILKAGKVGSLLNLVGADKTMKAQTLIMDSSGMKIPLLFGLDVIHGFRTIFPVPLGEAASWDMEAIEKSARIAAVEATSNGIHWTFAPMVDIARDPRWGRIMEGAGEDTYLGSRVAEARVHGFQGDDLSDPTTLVACAKHFAGYGAAEAGRDYNTTEISERTLREVYLPPFEAALKAGVGTFMNSFNEISGIPSTGNRHIQRDILKGEWKFDGFVVSDWGSIREMINHGVVENNKDAAQLAVMAGCDMDMESQAYSEFLMELVEEGSVSVKYIDDAVRRILRIKFRLGLFDDPYRYCDPDRAGRVLLSNEHLEHAQKISRESIVLLKNENILPLNTRGLTIAVIGPLANSKEDMLGTWVAMGRGEECTSLLEGINMHPGMKNKILTAKGCDIDSDDKSGFNEAIRIAKRADVLIVAVGESGKMTGEAKSRAYIDIPGVQVELLRELKKTGKPIITVLMNGRPLAIPWLAENTNAILETWFLGTRAGNAIADVIFGDYNPSGKLPVSFPLTLGQVPVYYNHKNTGRPATESFFTSKYLDVQNEPLFPFGFGLSYTTFEYSDIELSSHELSSGDSIVVTVNISNSGEYDGFEVAQLYIRDLVASVTRPVKELKGFQRVFIKAGESEIVSFTVNKELLRFWNIDMDFVAEPGDFKLFVGGNSRDVKESEFKLK